MNLNGALRPLGASTSQCVGSSFNGNKNRDKDIITKYMSKNFQNHHTYNRNIIFVGSSSDDNNNNNNNNKNNNRNFIITTDFTRKIQSHCKNDIISSTSNIITSKKASKMMAVKNETNKSWKFNKPSCNIGRAKNYYFNCSNIVNNLPIMNQVQQSLNFYFWFILCSIYVFSLLPNSSVYCDDNGFSVNNGESMGPETTTPFDLSNRGTKKFGDKCESTQECSFLFSVCDQKKKSCQCAEDYPATNHYDKCGREAQINDTCTFSEQCEMKLYTTECKDNRCVCRFEMTPIQLPDGSFECKGKQVKREAERHIDPAMIGVLVGMALMFIIICVVLRLFSNARWRENRTIFNTPNPRLMNVSLLRDNKLLHGQERRGSRMSVRVPSRQPSMVSLRPHSPNPSLGKTGSRTGSRGSSNASIRSSRSNSGVTTNLNINNGGGHIRRNSIKQLQQQIEENGASHQPLIANITSNPTVDKVTVQIEEPNK